jgi:Ca2+-binding RTX toxin-like protein
MKGYSTDEVIRTYNNITFNSYGDADSTDDKAPIVLADFEVNGEKNNAVLATQTGGRNVHFSTPGFMADNNLVWQALQWAVLDNKPKVALNMSRDESIFISRNDMDQSQESYDVNPDGNAPGIYDRLLPILTQWKNDYNFVGSYYINVGNNPANGQFTDWSVSKPYYDQMLALQNEIGTHSYTHPEFTDQLTPAQLEFEFNQSKLIIEQQLGIQVKGAAIPGNPEGLGVSGELQKYLDYVSGGYASVGAGYPNAFGFMFPGEDYVYFAPNMSFDFSLVEFRKLTPQQAEAEWLKEYNGLTNHASQAIIHFPWHDYGPTVWDTDPDDNLPSPYTEAMFTNFIAKAYQDNTEFVTVGDLSDRIKTFEKSKLFIDSSGNTITAKVEATGVGTFGLNVDPTQTIKSVNGWYAYDKDTVFLPANGGEFTINLGTTQDDVTHITDLPMRGELKSVLGNGTDLEFTFFGEGKVVLDLKNPTGLNIFTEGANSTTLNGEILSMNFSGVSLHTGKVRLAVDVPPTDGNIINGTVANNNIQGTVNRDIISGFGGDDIIDSRQGNDLIYGGDGKDNLRGNIGNDLIYGDADNDTIDGGDNNDTLYGGDGDDQLKGAKGNDILYGDIGNDKLDGLDDNDTLYGGKGNDDVRGGKGGIDTLVGVDPKDIFAGVGEIDKLSGGDQADLFILGDRNQAYYNDGNNANLGLSDYAVITDFNNKEGDKIQLYGTAANYFLGASPKGLPKGTAIFLITSNQNELIAIVEKETNVNTISSSFNFV